MRRDRVMEDLAAICVVPAAVLDVQIALCSVMTGQVSDRRLIQVIRRPMTGRE
jgi:hypothetical protein